MVIRDARRAAVLLTDQGMTYLAPYLGASRSIGEVARSTGTSLQRTFYWTMRLHEVGLIQVAATEARAGRPIRRYRAVADSFRVPADVLPLGWFDSLVTRLNRAMVRSYEAVHPAIVIDSDVWIHRGAHASGLTIERVSRVKQVEPPDALHSSFTARLSPEDASEFRAELAELRDRWVARAACDSSGFATYLAMLALAPLAQDDQ